jgi:hypothetical protein
VNCGWEGWWGYAICGGDSRRADRLARCSIDSADCHVKGVRKVNQGEKQRQAPKPAPRSARVEQVLQVEILIVRSVVVQVTVATWLKHLVPVRRRLVK